MQTIRLIFTRSWLPGSVSIQLFTWSQWSHVALIDGDEVIEANALHGVRAVPLVEMITSCSAFCIVDLPVRDAAALIQAARSQIGKPYDWTAVLGLILRRNWQAADAWFCSELIAWSADKAGSPWFRRNRIWRVTPEHLWMLAPAVAPADAP